MRLLGQLDREALAVADGSAAIFAHPARYEPFGLVVLEAALAGCALVLATSRRCASSGRAPRCSSRPATTSRSRGAAATDRRRRAARHAGGRACRRAARNDARTMAHAYAELYVHLCARSPRAVPA